VYAGLVNGNCSCNIDQVITVRHSLPTRSADLAQEFQDSFCSLFLVTEQPAQTSDPVQRRARFGNGLARFAVASPLSAATGSGVFPSKLVRKSKNSAVR
jgi:hypothetical protein